MEDEPNPQRRFLLILAGLGINHPKLHDTYGFVTQRITC